MVPPIHTVFGYTTYPLIYLVLLLHVENSRWILRDRRVYRREATSFRLFYFRYCTRSVKL